MGPYGCYRAQCLRAAVFQTRNVTTSYLTVIQRLKAIFTNMQYVCFAVLIKFHFKRSLLLFSQQFQMGDEIFLKYCAADVVTQEWVK